MNTRTADTVVGTEFRGFFADQLRKIYWAEIQWEKTLTKLKGAVTSQKLVHALQGYIKDSELNIQSVQKIFHRLGETPKEKKCFVMAGLVSEAEAVILNTEKDSHIRDAGLIMTAQKAAHYEIAVYGTLRVFANHMFRSDIRSELEKILEKEKLRDAELTLIAEDHINNLATGE